ncbi:PTS system cellobiose-specific IIB component [Spiroplasma sabaudiense Ar-1343]|uniref:PTS system cellobiose-specific IIB component n=1 Tax=Spiroplasma sabaudiense Ar-1343 TaxID=1276257 RepID=W6AJB4_9MOLU|nr:PTS sugar transporter subunit IIB [Spiroplasma sabaudiense]AHI53809.1 PTS system cellobiose-specific IIB component [Spiroplasma sabaudiense Ar-1343]
MKIMLVCNAGVSTSIVVKKMQDFAAKQNIEATIEAVPTADAINRTADWDVILLGPQVAFYLDRYKEAVNNQKPVAAINTRDYGMANGEAILNIAIKLIENFGK